MLVAGCVLLAGLCCLLFAVCVLSGVWFMLFVCLFLALCSLCGVCCHVLLVYDCGWLLLVVCYLVVGVVHWLLFAVFVVWCVLLLVLIA